MYIEKFTLSRDDGFMEGWPDLIRLTSGKILVVYNECVAHSNRDHTHITLRTSDDNGRSWSTKRYIGEETFHGDHWNSIRFSQLSDGRILLVCDRVSGVETTPETQLYLWESTDEGESWIPRGPMGIFGYCADKIRELSDGTLLLCVSVYNPATEKTEIMAHRSTDGGKTWSGRIPAARSDTYTFIEPAAAELGDGSVAVFLRENSQLGFNGFMVASRDKGVTFSQPREIPVPGMHRPFVGYLSDGRMLLSYRERPVSPAAYRNLKAWLFEESAVTGAESRSGTILQIDCGHAENEDQGYSAWAQLPDGTVLMANYITDDAPKPYIRGYFITLP